MEEYIVEDGDTLQRIAVKFNCTKSHLASENKLSHFQTVLFPGQKLKIPKVDGTNISDTSSTNRISLRATHKSHPGTATRISAPLPMTRSYSSETELNDISERQFVKFNSTRVVNSSQIPCPGTLLITPKFLVFDPERKPLDSDKDEVINNAEPINNVGVYICLESVYSLNTFSKLTEVIDKREILNIEDDFTNEISSGIMNREEYLYLIVKATPLSDAYDGPPISTLKLFTQQHKGSKIFIFGIPKDKIEEAYSFLIISGIGSGSQKTPKEIIDSDCKSDNELKNCDSQTVRSYETSFICKYNHFDNEDLDSSFDCGISWEVVDGSQASVVADALKEFEEEKFKPQLHCGTSEILTDDMLSDLAINLPSNLAGSNLFLVYQTGTHGYSLGTIYRKMKSSNSTPSLLLIKDNSNTVFGAYMPDNLHISTHYYGTGETFVFHWKPNFKKYEWTRENSFFLKGDRDCFAIGSKSGHSAIWFEDTLKYGRSEPTDTFENPTLCGKCNEIDQNNAETTINMLSINKPNPNEDFSNENSKEFYFVINCLEVWRFAM